MHPARGLSKSPAAGTAKGGPGSACMAAARSAALRHALRPLNGLRVISAIHIMVFHNALLRAFEPAALNDVFRTSPGALKAILSGVMALDALFLISGFLAALALVPALEMPRSSTRQEVLRYWYRRVFRIAPAHWACLVVTYVFMLRGRHAPMPPEAAAALGHFPEPLCPGGLWTHAAFLGHWHMSASCGLHLWSQGLQAAFWLWVPLLVAAARPQRAGFRRRAAMLAGAVIAASTAFRMWTAWRSNISLPVSVFFGAGDGAEVLNFLNYLDMHHSPLAMRAASLAIGCLAALPFLDPRSFQHPAAEQCTADGADVLKPTAALKQPAVATISVMSCKTALIGTDVAAAVAAVMYATPVFKAAGARAFPRAVTVLYLVTMLQGGILSSAALMFIMVVAMTRAGVTGRLLHGALGAPIWRPLADLSYSAYLYHEQARFWVWRYGLLPSGLATSADDLGAFAVDMAVSVPATFAIAFLSYRLVELPASKLGRRLEPLLFGGPAADAKVGGGTLAADAADGGKAGTPASAGIKAA